MHYRPGMTEFRIEHDSMGEVRVPTEAKWEAQTQRAVDNFPISGLRIERSLIAALAAIKGAAAMENARLEGARPDASPTAIQDAAAEVADRAAGTTSSPSTSSRPGRAPRPT